MLQLPRFMPHAWPAPTQTVVLLPLPTQQPFIRQALLAQQGAPGIPHEAQTPFVQVVPIALHMLFAQQRSPRLPQETQVLLAQRRPLPQVLLLQQTPPAMPHMMQTLLRQVVPPAEQVLPPQQA